MARPSTGTSSSSSMRRAVARLASTLATRRTERARARHSPAASGAAVGISVRDEEDSAAVVQAFTQGVATTGGTPLALLLDNRPSNHTPEVDAAPHDTTPPR